MPRSGLKRAAARPFQIELAVRPEDDRRGDGRPEIHGQPERREHGHEDRPSRHARSAASESGRPPKAPEDMRIKTSPGRASRRTKAGISSMRSGAKAGLPPLEKRRARAARSRTASG